MMRRRSITSAWMGERGADSVSQTGNPTTSAGTHGQIIELERRNLSVSSVHMLLRSLIFGARISRTHLTSRRGSVSSKVNQKNINRDEDRRSTSTQPHEGRRFSVSGSLSDDEKKVLFERLREIISTGDDQTRQELLSNSLLELLEQTLTEDESNSSSTATKEFALAILEKLSAIKNNAFRSINSHSLQESLRDMAFGKRTPQLERVMALRTLANLVWVMDTVDQVETLPGILESCQALINAPNDELVAATFSLLESLSRPKINAPTLLNSPLLSVASICISDPLRETSVKEAALRFVRSIANSAGSVVANAIVSEDLPRLVLHVISTAKRGSPLKLEALKALESFARSPSLSKEILTDHTVLDVLEQDLREEPIGSATKAEVFRTLSALTYSADRAGMILARKQDLVYVVDVVLSDECVGSIVAAAAFDFLAKLSDNGQMTLVFTTVASKMERSLAEESETSLVLTNAARLLAEFVKDERYALDVIHHRKAIIERLYGAVANHQTNLPLPNHSALIQTACLVFLRLSETNSAIRQQLNQLPDLLTSTRAICDLEPVGPAKASAIQLLLALWEGTAHRSSTVADTLKFETLIPSLESAFGDGHVLNASSCAAALDILTSLFTVELFCNELVGNHLSVFIKVVELCGRPSLEDDIQGSLLTFIYQSTRFEESRRVLVQLNAKKALEPLATAVDWENPRVNAFAALAFFNLTGKEESASLELIKTHPELFDKLINVVDEVYRTGSYQGVHIALQQVLECFFYLSLIPETRAHLRERITPLFQPILSSALKNSDMNSVQLMLKILSQFAFDKQSLEKIRNDDKLMSSLKLLGQQVAVSKLPSSKYNQRRHRRGSLISNVKVKSELDGLLWTLENGKEKLLTLKAQISGTAAGSSLFRSFTDLSRSVSQGTQSLVGGPNGDYGTEDGSSGPVGSSTRPRVMVSYSWKHKDIARSIAKVLERWHFDIWVDFDAMSGSVMNAMAEGVSNADVIIILVSSAYHESANCQREASFAAELEKKIVPIVVDPTYPKKGWLALLIANELRYELTEASSTYVEAQMRVIAEKELLPLFLVPTNPIVFGRSASPLNGVEEAVISRKSSLVAVSGDPETRARRDYPRIPDGEEAIRLWTAEHHLDGGIDLIEAGFTTSEDIRCLEHLGPAELKALLDIQKPVYATRLHSALRQLFAT